MGYGYGVWLIIEDKDWIKTNHVPHITIACFMKYEDAYCLYSDILDIMMTSLMNLNDFEFRRLSSENTRLSCNE